MPRQAMFAFGIRLSCPMLLTRPEVPGIAGERDGMGGAGLATAMAGLDLTI